MHADDMFHQLDDVFETEGLSNSLRLEEVFFGNIEVPVQSVSLCYGFHRR